MNIRLTFKSVLLIAGHSEEMKEVGRPHETKENDEGRGRNYYNSAQNFET